SYFYSRGHRRFGFLAHHATLGPVSERLQSVLAAARRHRGVQVATAADADTLEGGRRAARALLDAHPRVTALLCVNDLMAVGAMRELRARGRRVPEDVSVTGFDNITLAQFCHPALTTVHIPSDTIRETICHFLMNPGKAPLPHEFVIDPELVRRESTGPAPSARQ